MSLQCRSPPYSVRFDPTQKRMEEMYMKKWQRDRNFRKYHKTDGSYAFYITIDGKKVQVSEEVYLVYAKTARKMEYMEQDLKRNRMIKDAYGKTILGDDGNPIYLPEREVSLEHFFIKDWESKSSIPSTEDTFMKNEFSEIDDLLRSITLLEEDEQALIQALYFDGKTIREYAESIGKTKSSVDRYKTKILGKLKSFLEAYK
jgi:RNA polymerase sigma factor (sigma-70 family)